ncbi:adenine nucleotide alpha hydrolase family protein [bacterium]|nr:adenine nucleotide alpha hydrolase family protein [bacterium]
MWCIKCKGPASIYIRRHNSAFCEEHYLEYMRKQVERAIEYYKMFTREEKILVAVSGGKDSLALWDILLDLGYTADGIHIDIGIGEYSIISKEKVRTFASSRGVKCYEVNLKDIYQTSITYIARKNNRSYCSTCGVIKRYIMNLFTVLVGYDVIVTGHNLDDESASLLGNVLHWQIEYLRSQFPIMPKELGFSRKAKPLCRVTDEETTKYCDIKCINYVSERCPLSKKAQSLVYKELLSQLEASSPGSKAQFYFGFLERGKRYFVEKQETLSISNCKICGQPTTEDICSFCRQMRRAGLDPLLLKSTIERNI